MKFQSIKPYSIASRIIAIPIMTAATLSYITSAIILPSNEVFPMAIAAFGITAALSGVCFTMAPSKGKEPIVRYAGEKLLHASLLLLQIVLVIYAKDALLSISYIGSLHIIKIILNFIFSILIGIISTGAAINWFWGFNSLNEELWEKWKNRIKNQKTSSIIEEKITLKTN